MRYRTRGGRNGHGIGVGGFHVPHGLHLFRQLTLVGRIPSLAVDDEELDSYAPELWLKVPKAETEQVLSTIWLR